MPKSEIDQLNNVITTINQQLNSLADLTEEIAKWPDGKHKQECFDKIFAQQDSFAKQTQKIFDRLKQLGI